MEIDLEVILVYLLQQMLKVKQSMTKMPLFFLLIINLNIILKNQVMLFIAEKIMALILVAIVLFILEINF